MSNAVLYTSSLNAGNGKVRISRVSRRKIQIKQELVQVPKRKTRMKSSKPLAVENLKMKLKLQLQQAGTSHSGLPLEDTTCKINNGGRRVTIKKEGLADKIRDNFSTLSNMSNSKKFASNIKEKFSDLSSGSTIKNIKKEKLDCEEAPPVVNNKNNNSNRNLRKPRLSLASPNTLSDNKTPKNRMALQINKSIRSLMNRQQQEKEHKLRKLWEEYPEMDFLALQDILAASNWDLNKAKLNVEMKQNLLKSILEDVPSSSPNLRKRKTNEEEVSKPTIKKKKVNNNIGGVVLTPEVLKQRLQQAFKKSELNNAENVANKKDIKSENSNISSLRKHRIKGIATKSNGTQGMRYPNRVCASSAKSYKVRKVRFGSVKFH